MESATRLHQNRLNLIRTQRGICRREAETPDLTQGTGIRLWGFEASELQRHTSQSWRMRGFPSRSAPSLGGQTASLVGQKHHLSGSECESGSGGVVRAAEWFVRERVWSVMSWVCIFRPDVHLPLDLDQGIIFRMRKCKQCSLSCRYRFELQCTAASILSNKVTYSKKKI